MKVGRQFISSSPSCRSGAAIYYSMPFAVPHLWTVGDALRSNPKIVRYLARAAARLLDQVSREPLHSPGRQHDVLEIVRNRGVLPLAQPSPSGMAGLQPRPK